MVQRLSIAALLKCSYAVFHTKIAYFRECVIGQLETEKYSNVSVSFCRVSSPVYIGVRAGGTPPPPNSGTAIFSGNLFPFSGTDNDKIKIAG